jgi:hypothetical protein
MANAAAPMRGLLGSWFQSAPVLGDCRLSMNRVVATPPSHLLGSWSQCTPNFGVEAFHEPYAQAVGIEPSHRNHSTVGGRHGLRWQSAATTPLSHGARLPKAAWRCASRRSPRRCRVDESPFRFRGCEQVCKEQGAMRTLAGGVRVRVSANSNCIAAPEGGTPNQDGLGYGMASRLVMRPVFFTASRNAVVLSDSTLPSAKATLPCLTWISRVQLAG